MATSSFYLNFTENCFSMKKIINCILLLVIAITPAMAQTAKTPAAKSLKKVLELKMPKTAEDDMPGTRGASVAWHPLQKKYYAVMAGNAAYPLAVFGAQGKRLSDDDLAAMIDTRGLWYNPITKKICGNGYNESGWFYYNFDKAGLVSGYDILLEGMNQPGEQCVGAYNATAKNILFLKGSEISIHDAGNGQSNKTLMIHWGRKKAQGAGEGEDAAVTPEAYNNTTVVYTGIKGQELGFLNAEKKQVELYDISSGFITNTLKLPADVATETSFNFAYTNGMYWLFDMENRIWKGYK
jgi:hypothetical protein